jgi:hypothetical protein
MKRLRIEVFAVRTHQFDQYTLSSAWVVSWNFYLKMLENQIITFKKKSYYIIMFFFYYFLIILFNFKKIVTGFIEYLCGLGTTVFIRRLTLE